jgi:DNA/RNA-binding domain of Phe-tRNA-synthetase-like protein
MFGYDSAIVERFPTIRAGVVHATGLAVGPSPPQLLERYRVAQEACSTRLRTSPIAEIPSIEAWRRAFSAFGAKPTQYRSAVEALLRRLSKQGDIPSVNNLVDLGNMISICYDLPVAAFDVAALAGPLTVRFAAGTESFTDLGSSETGHPDPGEVVFVDPAGVVSARRWCWRQSADSATDPSTVEALIVIEGLHDDAASDVPAALTELTSLLTSHQPASNVTSQLLSANKPRIA